MVKIIKQDLVIDVALKRKIDFICEFAHTKADYINGSIKRIDKTNLIYVEPHRAIIKNTNFLIFDNHDDIYIENLNKSLKLNELEEYLKSL